jgi:predicted NUDIX family NTP pyrophosphohydrolase
MSIISAGLLMCRWWQSELQYFLVHPGGPYFKNKNEGAWTIPKGLQESQEDLLAAAIREFTEETGIIPHPPYQDLGSIKQKGGKLVHAWTFIGEWDDTTEIETNTFLLEWPPKSGKKTEFPEIDKAEWMSFEKAMARIIAEQQPFLSSASNFYKSAIK